MHHCSNRCSIIINDNILSSDTRFFENYCKMVQSSSEETLAMEGVMMKKKTATPFILRPITLEWVTRHFFLYEDGKMIYARDGASVNPDDMVLLCNNIANCDIDRVTASELGKKKNHVANSFYITVPRDDDTDFAKRHKNRTLLVTHGPEDFKKWIMAFRRLKARVNVEVQEEDKALKATSPQTSSNVLVEKEKSLIPTEVSSNNAVEVSALFMSDAKFGDSAVFDVKDLKEDANVDKLETVDDGEQSVHFSDKVDVISIPGSDKEERSVGKVVKSVSFDHESMGEIIPDVDQMSEISGDGDSEKKVVQAFNVFDKDGSCSISSDEFRKIIYNLGEKLTSNEIEEIIKMSDIDGDG